MSRPESDSTVWNLPTSCRVFGSKLRTFPTFKVLELHPETQPNVCDYVSRCLEEKGGREGGRKETKQTSKQSKKNWGMEEVKRERKEAS